MGIDYIQRNCKITANHPVGRGSVCDGGLEAAQGLHWHRTHRITMDSGTEHTSRTFEALQTRRSRDAGLVLFAANRKQAA